MEFRSEPFPHLRESGALDDRPAWIVKADLKVLLHRAGWEITRYLMDRIEVVVLELPVRNIYEGAPTMQEMLSRMNGLGFEILSLTPVTRDSSYFRVIEFDGIFVRH